MRKIKSTKNISFEKSETLSESGESEKAAVIPIDKEKFNLLSDDCKNFFERVHHIYELNKKYLKLKRWDDPKVKAIIDKCGLHPFYNKPKEKFKIQPSESNDIYFNVWGGKGVAKHFIRHLRNSVSHLNIEATNTEGEIHLQDWNEHGKRNRKKTECTMDMKIQFSVLKELVTTLLSEYWDK